MKVCAITNVYNEAFNLRKWLSHYGKQVGSKNCIILDHGSDDGSTIDIGKAGRVNIPRTTFSDHVRAKLISGIASAMLSAYDAVIYSDCDELLVADPTKYENLIEFCSLMKTPCATAIGLNVIQNLAHEGSIDLDRGILSQRSFVQFVSPMCKSLVIRKSITWGGGFHGCNYPMNFDDLYLFHLRWVDIGECLRRLTITRGISFADNVAAPHHRAEYLDYVKIFRQLLV